MTRWLLPLVATCVWCWRLPGQEERLLLRPLIREALRNNPEILAAQKRYEAVRQRPDRDSSLPEPVVSLGYASSGNPLPLAGLGVQPTSNVGFLISQDFPFPGKRKLRGDIAFKEAEAAFQDYRAAQLSVLSRLKQAYHRLHHSYEAIAVMERSRELLRQLLRAAEARYAVGRAAQTDLFQTHTRISILETRIEKMEQEKRRAEAEINWLLARPPDAPLPRPGAILPGELRVQLDELYARAREHSPLLARQEKRIQRAELALNLARKDYYPDYAVSAGYFNMGRMPDMYQVRVDFKLPAYFWRKQRAEVAEQAHGLSEERRSFQALDQTIRFQIRENYLMAQTSYRLMRSYADEVIPQASLALESSLASYETGAGDFLTVLSNFTTVFESEEKYHEEMLSFHLSLVRLEELTGTELIDWVK
ncbi:MAG: TolC family protein [Bryobacterales bacterium]|nr:TolC family protein [Bryobacteraceae bacterium]MDW8353235.1 TolC family protein [Bryobacterales bacterium]